MKVLDNHDFINSLPEYLEYAKEIFKVISRIEEHEFNEVYINSSSIVADCSSGQGYGFHEWQEEYPLIYLTLSLEEIQQLEDEKSVEAEKKYKKERRQKTENDIKECELKISWEQKNLENLKKVLENYGNPSS